MKMRKIKVPVKATMSRQGNELWFIATWLMTTVFEFWNLNMLPLSALGDFETWLGRKLTFGYWCLWFWSSAKVRWCLRYIQRWWTKTIGTSELAVEPPSEERSFHRVLPNTCPRRFSGRNLTLILPEENSLWNRNPPWCALKCLSTHFWDVFSGMDHQNELKVWIPNV